MVWQCGTKPPDNNHNIQRSCALLACCSLLTLAPSGQSAAKCLFPFFASHHQLAPRLTPSGLRQSFGSFFFFIFVQSVCIFRLSSALSRLAFPLIGRTWLRGAWKAFVVHRAERRTWKSSHAVNRSVLQFFKPNTCRLNGQAPRSSFFIGHDNYITVHDVTLWKTFSRGHKKEMEPQKCALNVSSFVSHSSRTVGEGTEGKSWLLLAFLMSRRRPFSSAKINIWALVVPLCLIRGHPGLHIQEFIDPENFIQSNSRPWAASASFITVISDSDVFTTTCKWIVS